MSSAFALEIASFDRGLKSLILALNKFLSSYQFSKAVNEGWLSGKEEILIGIDNKMRNKDKVIYFTNAYQKISCFVHSYLYTTIKYFLYMSIVYTKTLFSVVYKL